jgi:hypothetical protein
MIGGQDQSGAAQAGNGGEDSKFGCSFHSSFLFVQGGKWYQNRGGGATPNEIKLSRGSRERG